MKRVILIVLPLFFLLSFSAKKKRRFIPPGMVRISDTLFMDKTEVTNLSWYEYLYWLKNMYGSDSPEYQAAVPDSTVWLYDGMSSNLPWQNSFKQIKFFKDYPVSGISYDQALAFCKWRTDRVRHFVSLSDRYRDCDFSFRLPSCAEWEFVSDGSPEVFSHLNPPIVINASPTATIMNVTWPANLHFEQGASFSHPIAVGSYKPNRLGIYDMTGNVAEMLREKGLAKGGSFYHSVSEARNGKSISYEKATAWLGFRCVCVVYYKK